MKARLSSMRHALRLAAIIKRRMMKDAEILLLETENAPPLKDRR
jgi:hypothetical protein